MTNLSGSWPGVLLKKYHPEHKYHIRDPDEQRKSTCMNLQTVHWQYNEWLHVFHHSCQTGRGSGAYKQRRNLSWQPSQMRGPNSSHHITTGLQTSGGGRRRHYFPPQNTSSIRHWRRS